MRAPPPANGTSQAAIFARLWEMRDGQLPRSLARQILKLQFSEQDKARMHELATRNQQERLSPAELQELDNYIVVGDLLALLQSKARRSLRQRPASTRHG